MHKSWDDFEFNQIRPLTTDLPALECLKNQCIMFSTLAGNKDNYKVLDEFEIQPDPTMNN